MKKPLIIEAFINNGATLLVLSKDIVQKLKLTHGKTVEMRYADGRIAKKKSQLDRIWKFNPTKPRAM